MTSRGVMRSKAKGYGIDECGQGSSLFAGNRLAQGRVLGTSARKPPLSDTLLWATLSLAHPFKIEVILSKGVDVLPKQQGCEAQNIVVDQLAFSAELADYIPDVQRFPSNDSVVRDRQTTERVDLIAELASPQRALLAKAEESRQVVRSLTFVKFAADSSAIFLVIQSS